MDDRIVLDEVGRKRMSLNPGCRLKQQKNIINYPVMYAQKILKPEMFYTKPSYRDKSSPQSQNVNQQKKGKHPTVKDTFQPPALNEICFVLTACNIFR